MKHCDGLERATQAESAAYQALFRLIGGQRAFIPLQRDGKPDATRLGASGAKQ
jgi:hypothetical protein